MYFNVSQLMRESSGSVRKYKVDDTIHLEDIGERSQIAGEVDLLRTDRGIWVSASLVTEISCACSRCLADTKESVSMAIEEEYLPQIDVITGAKLHEASESDENFYIDQNHLLDLTEAVNQYVDMNTPMKPMCSEMCAGICMTCGMNLNEFSCQCDKVVRDPRWDALVELVSSIDNNN